MASAAVRSKSPIECGVLCFVLVLLCISLCHFLVLQSYRRGKRAGCFASVVIFLACGVLIMSGFCVSSSRCRGVVCDCGISIL